MTPTEQDILDWYRADRPMPLDVWILQPQDTRETFIGAATQVALERYTLAVSVLADASKAIAPIDGGRLQERARILEAMEREALARRSA